MRRATFKPVIVLVAAVALLAGACHSNTRSSRNPSPAGATTTSGRASAATTSTTLPLGPAIVFSAQRSELDAYSTSQPFATQIVVPSPAASRDGVDVSGQICFDPTQPRRFVTVDTTAAADGQAGWGVFELAGRDFGQLSAHETARLVPTYQHSSDTAAPFGCGFLPDGRLLTTDLGNQSHGAADGQLIEWFPPFDQDTVVSCKVLVNLANPEDVSVDGDRVFVAEARAGVTSIVTSTLPTSNLATGGCARRDVTGAALALGVVHSPWLQNAAAHGLTQPAAVVRAGGGRFYVSSPGTGVIAEIDADGRFVRSVLAPPGRAVLGRRPFLTGTPMGLAVAANGTLYYADPGLIVTNATIVAGLRTGTIRRITFAGGVAQPPEVVDSGLQSPEGIAIWLPSP